MKRIFSICAVSAIAVSLFSQSVDTLQGTWQLVAYDHGQGRKMTTSKEREIKMFTADHFIWVVYETPKGVVRATGGGSYNLRGGSYVEHVDFMDKANSALVGKDQIFNIQLSADTMQVSGMLSQGLRIAEIWKKIN